VPFGQRLAGESGSSASTSEPAPSETRFNRKGGSIVTP
jgi:hypothetical protein